MGYYRKGHFKKNGTWVSGHYVNKYGSRRSKSPQGCAVIILGGIISVIMYLLG
ncbi:MULTISPECIES: hypothetical protein [unclassified Chryseobacterium]|uniref:hypothetical protein n=1 Tax=unclassified Chryseobacterium TaxID=2593645 RepID=UPI001167D3C3|nr:MULTISPECIES: hypothetical protein [unclassified Chryseobacterium]MBO9692594.1 hypothetical protein [Chryseobacterium sp.]GEJ44953.1 hypothetical protein CRS_15610 [Chryseobacterium sp. ON_d1]